MHTIEEWLSFSCSTKPYDDIVNRASVPCPVQYFYADGTTDMFLDTYNHKLKELWWQYYDEEDLEDVATNYFLYNCKRDFEFVHYDLFLKNSVKKGLIKKTVSPNPRIPQNTLTHSYGMMTFTSPRGHFDQDDNKAILYFDSVVNKYLVPDSKFRISEPGLMNIWLECESGDYYHLHVFYQRELGLYYTVNKGTLKVNKTIQWFINNLPYKPKNYPNFQKYIDHCNKALLYDYNDKTSRVVKPYFREISKID